MGIVINQSVKSAFYSYIGVGLGVISTLFLYPKFLSPAQLGLTMGVMLPLASILAHVALLGTTNSAFYFASHFKNHSHQPRFLQYLIRILLIGIVLIMLVYIFLKPWFVQHYSKNSALFIDYYWWVLPLTLFVVSYNFLEAYIRSQQEIVFTNFTREVLLRVLTIFSLVLFIFNIISFNSFVALFILIWFLLFIALLFYCYNKPYFSISISADFDHIVNKKEIILYSFINVLSGTAWAITGNLDSLMVAKYIGLSDTGVFRLAIFICTVVQVPQRTITQILLSLLSEHFKNNQLEKIADLYKKSSTQLLVAGSFIVILILMNIDDFLKLLPTEYAGAKWVVIILCIARLFDMATSINGEIIQTSNYYRYNLYFILILLVFTVFSNIIFIPKFGLIGAAIASMITLLVFNFLKLSFVWIKFRMQPFTINSVFILTLALAIYLISFFIPSTNQSILNIIIRSSICSILFIFSVIQLKLSPEINAIITKQYLKYFKKN